MAEAPERDQWAITAEDLVRLTSELQERRNAERTRIQVEEGGAHPAASLPVRRQPSPAPPMLQPQAGPSREPEGAAAPQIDLRELHARRFDVLGYQIPAYQEIMEYKKDSSERDSSTPSTGYPFAESCSSGSMRRPESIASMSCSSGGGGDEQGLTNIYDKITEDIIICDRQYSANFNKLIRLFIIYPSDYECFRDFVQRSNYFLKADIPLGEKSLICQILHGMFKKPLVENNDDKTNLYVETVNAVMFLLDPDVCRENNDLVNKMVYTLLQADNYLVSANATNMAEEEYFRIHDFIRTENDLDITNRLLLTTILSRVNTLCYHDREKCCILFETLFIQSEFLNIENLKHENLDHFVAAYTNLMCFLLDMQLEQDFFSLAVNHAEGRDYTKSWIVNIVVFIADCFYYIREKLHRGNEDEFTVIGSILINTNKLLSLIFESGVFTEIIHQKAVDIIAICLLQILFEFVKIYESEEFVNMDITSISVFMFYENLNTTFDVAFGIVKQTLHEIFTAHVEYFHENKVGTVKIMLDSHNETLRQVIKITSKHQIQICANMGVLRRARSRS